MVQHPTVHSVRGLSMTVFARKTEIRLQTLMN